MPHTCSGRRLRQISVSHRGRTHTCPKLCALPRPHPHVDPCGLSEVRPCHCQHAHTHTYTHIHAHTYCPTHTRTSTLAGRPRSTPANTHIHTDTIHKSILLSQIRLGCLCPGMIVPAPVCSCMLHCVRYVRVVVTVWCHFCLCVQVCKGGDLCVCACGCAELSPSLTLAVTKCWLIVMIKCPQLPQI